MKLKENVNLKAIASYKGYSGAELARRVGASRQMINRVFKRERNVSPKIAYGVANALDMEMADLFEFEGR